MSDLYVLDTNIYVEALRNGDALRELKTFLTRAGMRVRVDGVVAAELLAGASSPEKVRAVDALLTPYRLRRLVTAASFTACAEAGRVLAALQFNRRGARRVVAESLVRDAFLAASCREAGAVLITRNASDFRAIQTHMRGFRFLPPWPIGLR